MELEVEKVQNIASKMKSRDIDGIPSEFIRPEDEQPGTTTVDGSVLEVPTIDVGDPDEERLVGLISKASKEWGLFQVVNHGIPTQVIENLQRVGKEFFELPQQDKELYAKPPGYKGGQGYGTMLRKQLEDVRPWVDHLFHIIWPPSAIDYQFWPNTPPLYREANEDYSKYLRGVTEKLLKCLSKGVGLEEYEMKEASGGGEELVYLLKINYYPPCPRPDLALGVVAHTDMSLLTILVPNDVPGLQVCRDGLWYDVHYIPNALIIHIGDQLEVLSNGKYKAVVHRTRVNKEKTRMSWPVFIEPPPEHQVGPIPKLINEANPAKYKTKKFADYKYCKLNKLPQ